MALRRRTVARLAILAVLLLVILVSSPVWLPLVGRALVSSGGPRKADIAVALAGDYYGRRILVAAQLVREGYVPKVLVSGPRGLYGQYECDLAIRFAVERGYPEEYFIRAPHEGLSTREEAGILIAKMREMGVKSYILVTSDYHTRRSGRFFRGAAPEMTVHVVAAPNSNFEIRKWWEAREGQKAVFMEWVKTVTSYFGV